MSRISLRKLENGTLDLNKDMVKPEYNNMLLLNNTLDVI
jgi:hypothetical protein